VSWSTFHSSAPGQPHQGRRKGARIVPPPQIGRGFKSDMHDFGGAIAIVSCILQKSWDFVKNREISETSKVVLLLWIKCIKKSVLYLASRILIVEICLCWTYSSYVLCLILEILEQNSVSWSFHWKLSAMFLQNKWKQELHYLLYMAINTL
jgi:hypothetical protein